MAALHGVPRKAAGRASPRFACKQAICSRLASSPPHPATPLCSAACCFGNSQRQGQHDARAMQAQASRLRESGVPPSLLHASSTTHHAALEYKSVNVKETCAASRMRKRKEEL